MFNDYPIIEPASFTTALFSWQYDFMISGLRETEQDLRAKHIPFHLTMGDPGVCVGPPTRMSRNAFSLSYRMPVLFH